MSDQQAMYVWITTNGQYVKFSEVSTHVGTKTVVRYTSDINEASVCSMIPRGLTKEDCSQIAVKAEATATRVVTLVKE